MTFWLRQTVLFATGGICAFAGFLWTAILLLGALFGLSAMHDDIATTETKLSEFFVWLIQQDASTASFIAAGLLATFGLFTVAYCWASSASYIYKARTWSPTNNKAQKRYRDVFAEGVSETGVAVVSLSTEELGELCIYLCKEVHEYVARTEPPPIEPQPDNWSESIRQIQEAARAEMGMFRKEFGARLYYVEDEFLRMGLRRLALDERTLSSMEERARVADEIGAVGFRILACRQSPIAAWSAMNKRVTQKPSPPPAAPSDTP